MHSSKEQGEIRKPSSEICKEIEENKTMWKTRDLFKKIRDAKGTFHAKMGSKKDRNGIDLTEAEDIKKSWKEYTEELYKIDLHDQDNHDGVITDLEPDILECKVKWASDSITTNKASGGDGVPVEFFQILADDAMKVLHSICQQILKTQQWPQDWKRSVSFQSQRKAMSKNVQTTAQLHSSQFSSVQSLSRVRLFATPWIAARQASLSITNSRSTPRLTSWGQWCHPAISSSVVPFSSCPQSLPASESFPMSQLFAWVGQSTGDSL